MTAFRLFMFASILAATTLVPTPACADGGHISFSGRIVEATCDTPTSAITGAETAASSPRMSCSIAGKAVSPTHYALTTERLGADPADRVLSYFSNYVRAANPGNANPVLLTRIYQ